MKLSGEAQAEIIKLAVMLTVGALVIYTAKNTISNFYNSTKSGITGAVDAVTQGFSDAVDTVVAIPEKAWTATKEVASNVADSVIKNEPLTPEQKRNLPYDESTGMVWGP